MKTEALEVGVWRFEVRVGGDNRRKLRLAVGGDLAWCSDDHDLFFCLDIVITNNKRDRRRELY
jgi:hypothetical protein